MKKVFGLLILSLFAKSLVAQDENRPFEGALRFTPIFMWTKADVEDATRYKAENEGLKIGFAYGIMGDFYFADNAAISTELRIAHLGASFTVTDMTGSADTIKTHSLKTQYIELPVSLKMRTNEVGYMRFYGQFGLMPSIRLKAKEDTEIQYISSHTSLTDVNVNKSTNLVGLSLVIGAGTTYNLGGTTSLLGGVSFHNGFTNMVKVDDYHAKIKPAYIALNLGVIF
jgi:hypothetical protein